MIFCADFFHFGMRGKVASYERRRNSPAVGMTEVTTGGTGNPALPDKSYCMYKLNDTFHLCFYHSPLEPRHPGASRFLRSFYLHTSGDDLDKE